MYSDASGSFGCGAFDLKRGWFQFQWPNGWADKSIASKEMIPIIVAAALWGKSWSGKHICFHSDNMAVVAVLTKRSAKDDHLLGLLRCLFFYAPYYKFHYSALHIPGIHNMQQMYYHAQLLMSFPLLYHRYHWPPFFAFMRSGEFTCPSARAYNQSMLSPSDVVVDNRDHPSSLSTLLRASKTDVFQAGHTLLIRATGDLLCTVAAVLGYMASRPGSPGPLFILEDDAH